MSVSYVTPAEDAMVGDKLQVGKHWRPITHVERHHRGVSLGLDWDKCQRMFVPYGFELLIKRDES